MLFAVSRPISFTYALDLLVICQHTIHPNYLFGEISFFKVKPTRYAIFNGGVMHNITPTKAVILGLLVLRLPR